MIIIGVDYHPSDQYIAFVDTETGEYGERQLNHSEREAEKFYRELAARRAIVRVGMEATWYSHWFERLMAELGIEAWIGDAAEIKTKRVCKQKTDREDARLLLRLLRENNFPRIWVPSPENRDLRQLLWHRHRMVQMRTRIMSPSSNSRTISRVHTGCADETAWFRFADIHTLARTFRCWPRCKTAPEFRFRGWRPAGASCPVR
jgi:hypothetical protein